MSFVGLLFWICCHVSHAITLAGLRVSVFIILTTKTGKAFLTQRGFHTSERAPFCLCHYNSVDSNCSLTKKLVCDGVLVTIYYLSLNSQLAFVEPHAMFAVPSQSTGG